MPMVGRKVEQFFGRPPVVRINPDEVVSLGAAIQATLLDRGRKSASGPVEHPRIAEDSVVEALPLSEPPAAADALVLPVVGRPAPPAPPVPPPAAPAAPKTAQFLPGRGARTLVFDVPQPAIATPFDLELPSEPARPPPPPPAVRPHQPTMQYPFEVERPARPPRPAPLLIDVTPLSLGVETVGGFCDVLIDANTPVPCDRTRSFATATDSQTTVRIRVSQGSSKRFDENTCLGELELTGIAPAPRGETQVAVTFEIDADGILQVRARDVVTGRQTAARIQLVGAHAGPAELQAMQARQNAHPLAPLEPQR
jgi:molecular chaperone DnaK